MYILKLWNWNKNFKFRFTFFPLERKGVNHRIRLNTEEKAKVVAAAWGTALILLLAALAILHQDDLKKRMNRIKATGSINVLKKRMIIRFTPYQITPLLKWMFSQKPLFKTSLLLKG